MEANSENYPWIYANKSGWLDSETISKWFEQFEEKQGILKRYYRLFFHIEDLTSIYNIFIQHQSI